MGLNNFEYLKRPRDILLFIEVFFTLLILKALTDRIKLEKLLNLLEPKRKSNLNLDKIRQIHTFSNFFIYDLFKVKNPCMLRSLLIYRYMRSMDQDLKIVFGVKEDMGGLKGHAWLLYRDKPFLEEDIPSGRFTATWVY